MYLPVVDVECSQVQARPSGSRFVVTSRREDVRLARHRPDSPAASAGPGTPGPLPTAGAGRKLGSCQFIASPDCTVPRPIVVARSVWSTLKSYLLPLILRTGLYRKLLAMPVPRFGSGKHVQQVSAYGIDAVRRNTMLPGKAPGCELIVPRFCRLRERIEDALWGGREIAIPECRRGDRMSRSLRLPDAAAFDNSKKKNVLRHLSPRD